MKPFPEEQTRKHDLSLSTSIIGIRFADNLYVPNNSEFLIPIAFDISLTQLKEQNTVLV